MGANAGVWKCQAFQDGGYTHKAFARRSSHGIDLSPTFSVEEEDWNRVMDINLKGTMLCFKYAAQQMIKQGSGGVLIGNAWF